MLFWCLQFCQTCSASIQLNWLITNVTSYLVITVIILFQPELRRLITQFGQRNWISGDNAQDALQLDELVNALTAMSEEKIGSLIVIERSTGLRSYSESGVVINSLISDELIRTIFFPNTALHDGAIIIQKERLPPLHVTCRFLTQSSLRKITEPATAQPLALPKKPMRWFLSHPKKPAAFLLWQTANCFQKSKILI